MDCKTFENRIFDYSEETLSDPERKLFEKHLGICSKCTRDLEVYRAISSKAAAFESVRAPEGLWHQIETQLEAPKSSFFTRFLESMASLKQAIQDATTIPAPVFQLAGVGVILIVGILVGRYFLPSSSQEALVQQTGVPARNVQMISSRTNQFVEKSKILFLGIVNAGAAEIEDSDWHSEKRIARGLIQEASFLKNDLNDLRNERIRLLIDELELILLEIANLEEEHDVENIELIKSGIDQKGLLLKINLHDLDEDPVVARNPRGTEL